MPADQSNVVDVAANNVDLSDVLPQDPLKKYLVTNKGKPVEKCEGC
jgi:hypothetical protein